MHKQSAAKQNSSKIKYSYRDPFTGNIRTEFRNDGENNPFFSEFEELINKLKSEQEIKENIRKANSRYSGVKFNNDDLNNNPNNMKYKKTNLNSNEAVEKLFKYAHYIFYGSLFMLSYYIYHEHKAKKEIINKVNKNNFILIEKK